MPQVVPSDARLDEATGADAMKSLARRWLGLGEIIERRLLAASAGRPLFLTCCGRNCSAPSQAAPKLTIAGLVAWNLGSSAAVLIALRSIVGLALVSGAVADRGASSTVPVFQPAQIDSSPTPPVDLEGLTAAGP